MAQYRRPRPQAPRRQISVDVQLDAAHLTMTGDVEDVREFFTLWASLLPASAEAVSRIAAATKKLKTSTSTLANTVSDNQPLKE